MSKVYKWERVRARAASQGWAKKSLELLRESFEQVKTGWPGDPPIEQTEWTHHYSCPTCGGHLLIELERAREHECPACHQVYTGQPYDGAFLASVHAQIAQNLEYAAILAHLMPDPAPYVAYIRRYTLFYASNYTKLWHVHGKAAGQGRIMPQCLTEAIFIITIEKMLRMVGDLSVFTEDELAMMRSSYFAPALELMRSETAVFRGGEIHNIQAWMVSAIGACAHALGDDQAWEDALNGRNRWFDQLRKGTSEEGLWYEISPGYHFYTLNALTAMALIAKERGMDLMNDPRLKRMVLAPFELVYPDMRMPAYNDTSYETSLAVNAVFLEPHVQTNPEIGKWLAWLYTDEKPRAFSHDNPLPTLWSNPRVVGRAGINALVLGVDELPVPETVKLGSRCLKDAGIAVLEGEKLRVGLKCTPFCGWHDHFDKLAVDVFASGRRFSPDLGTGPYAIPLTGKWNRASIAHNMLTVDGKPQAKCAIDSLTFDENRCAGVAANAYPGVVLERRLALTPEGFDDVFTAQSDEEHVYDWTFHGDGEMSLSVPMNHAPLFEAVNGYDTLWDVMTATPDGDVSAVFQTEYGSMTLLIKAAPGTVVFTAKAHRQDGLSGTNMLIVRRNGKCARFDARFVWDSAN